MPQTSTIDKVFQQSSIPLTLSDPHAEDHPLLKVNRSFSQMTGYAPDDCVGRNCRFLQGDDREQPARFELRDAIAEQRDIEVVLRNYTRAGTRFDNLLFVHHIRDSGGKVVYIMGSQFTIRDRTSADSLDRHLAELDRRYAALAGSQHATQLAAKRQLSATVGALLHSAVLQERLTGWREG